MLDTLDLSGDWKLTYGLAIGLATDTEPAQHSIPVQPGATYLVHFDRDTVTPATPGLPAFHADPVLGIDESPATPDGIRYKGYYYRTNPGHRPNSEQPGALMAEAWYADRGVFVVQIIDRVEQYIAVLSGVHQHYPTDLGYVQILGGWADVGEAANPLDTTVVTRANKGNFTLVKVPSPMEPGAPVYTP